MPHTGTPPFSSTGRFRWEGWRGEITGRERRFVPGVAAEICRRPDDRPRAETHPPNASMNVCLVNSGPCTGPPESWRLDLWFPYPVSRNGPAGPDTVIGLARLFRCTSPAYSP